MENWDITAHNYDMAIFRSIEIDVEAHRLMRIFPDVG
jgi:hypothetical protein